MTTPIFILSCARSGSTLLRLAMDTHPEVWSPPELHLLSLCQRWLWTVGVLEDRESAGEEFWDQATRKVRADADALLHPYLERAGKTRWCEKSVTSVNHLDVLEGVFPDAQRICLFRHVADLVHSGLRATEDRADGFDFEPYFNAWPHSRLEALTRYWLEKTQVLLTEKASANSLAVRYEDLAQNPVQSLQAIADACDLTPYPEWHHAVFRSDHQQGPGDASAYERKTFETASVGIGRELDFTTLPTRLLRQANELLAELDYPPIAR